MDSPRLSRLLLALRELPRRSALFAPFLASLRESPLAVWLDTAAWTHLPLFFWRHALRRVCEGRLGVGLIKEKPLKQLLARLALPAAKRRDGWLACCVGIVAQMLRTGRPPKPSARFAIWRALQTPVCNAPLPLWPCRLCTEASRVACSLLPPPPRLALKKETRAILCGTTLVLFRDVFPGHHAGRVWVPAPPAPVGTPVAPPPSDARLGGWRVSLQDAGQATDSIVDGGGGGGPANSGADGASPPPPTPTARSVELLELLSGRFTFTLPEAAGGYAVGETQKCVTPALGALEARWPGLVTAIPQLVPVGEPLAGTVAVTYEYVDCKHPSQSPERQQPPTGAC